jgi:hypothetical protein
MNMNATPNDAPLRTPAKVGAGLFVLWSILHIWVGVEGLHQYLTGSPMSQWAMLLGGRAMPREAFVHASDAATAFAHGQLIVNFAVDVGGYGVLGLFVSWMILKGPAWLGYVIGVWVIGIADLAFLFSMVTPGVIELNAGTVGGPVIWFLALLITPFGLPPISKTPTPS